MKLNSALKTCKNQETFVAVMQPYIFPYLGYFQLVKAVDEFVFYDDVNYIKQGWVNRNKILVHENEYLFTVPVKDSSQFKTINSISVDSNHYTKWEKKFKRTLQQSYKKAPFFNEVMELIENTLNSETKNIGELAAISIKNVAAYLGLKTKFKFSSEHFPHTRELTRSDRLIAITRELNSKNYVNALGGEKLYNKEYFKQNGVNIHFVYPALKEYSQLNKNFISGLSIIDILMFNNSKEVLEHLNNYELK